METESVFWRLTPFIDHPGDYGGTQYRFEWEREWRVPGNLVFDVGDVEFLFIPEELHGQAQIFFAAVELDNTGPVYKCPFLDPLWPEDRIQAALTGLDPPTI